MSASQEKAHTIRRLFDAALDLPAADREPFLAAECGGDDTLREAVLRLLHAESASGGFLNAPTLTSEGEPLPEAAGLPPGEMIGPYEITGELGRGGGGVVYHARQSQPVAREVALKLMPAAADSHTAARRFAEERRTLARMEHDHIARLYDAGVDACGRPWFAMELVRGQPVTRFCDTHRLTIPARLRLFADICRAVHHAHLRGVIHRDVKPSNLMVTGTAAAPVPKIIDFGIARALDNGDTAGLTRGGLIGTPAYMSPEQFGDGEVDARTDIFSLGLVLFELLCGTGPHTRPGGEHPSALQVARLLSEEKTPSLTRRFAALSPAEQQASAAARYVDPSTLRRILRGDAGVIAGKCLEHNPARRYASAEALAADCGNFLAHRPLAARPPGTLYAAGKFLRRHRAGAAAAGVALIAAGAGLTVSLRSHFARLQADEQARVEKERAAREGRKGYLITLAMTSLFRGAMPEYGYSPDRSVRDVVQAWTGELPAAVREDSEVEGLARLSLGNAWFGFGEPDKARVQYELAAALLAEPSPAFAPARGLTEVNLAQLALRERRAEEAGEHLRLARQFFTAAGGGYGDQLLRVELLLSMQYTDAGQPEEGAAVAQRVLETARADIPDSGELQARALWHLARAARTAGDHEWRRRLLRERLTLLKNTPHVPRGVVMEASVESLLAALPGDSAALPEAERVLAEYAALNGAHHAATLQMRTDIADALAQSSQPAAARERYGALLKDAPDAELAGEWRQSLSELE